MVKKYEKPCRYCGVNMLLKQLNDHTAAFMCGDNACRFFDFSETVTKWTVVKRSSRHLEEEAVSSKRLKQEGKKAATAALDQLVNDTYCGSFENSSRNAIVNQPVINNMCSDNGDVNGYVQEDDTGSINSYDHVFNKNSNPTLITPVNMPGVNLENIHNSNTETTNGINLDVSNIFDSIECENIPQKLKFHTFKYTSITIKSASL